MPGTSISGSTPAATAVPSRAGVARVETPLGDGAAAHVREEMQRLGVPFDEAVWDAGAKAHRLWTQPSAAPE